MKNFNFKDENEWRYVPLKKEIEGNFISINRKDYVNKIDYYNDLISKYSLKFNDIDIQKIYVENDNEKFIIHQKFNIALSKIEINT